MVTTKKHDGLDDLVSAAVLERLSSREVERVATTTDTVELHERLDAARAKREPFEDPDYVAVLGVAAATRALRKVDAEVEAIERELADAVGPVSEAPIRLDVADVWDELSTDERRQVVGSMIDSVVVSRGASRSVPLSERVRIYWQGEDDVPPRPSRGRRPEVEAGVATN